MKGLLKNKEKYELLTLANKANVEPQKNKEEVVRFYMFYGKITIQRQYKNNNKHQHLT